METEEETVTNVSYPINSASNERRTTPIFIKNDIIENITYEDFIESVTYDIPQLRRLGK